MAEALPILYSFRRCPYAIRARMAIWASEQQVELREILLKDKPPSMLQASPKGTVPVLILPDGRVLEESRDVMNWALDNNDPQQWRLSGEQQQAGLALTDQCDTEFKPWLDRYKYADRYPEQPQSDYREQAESFLGVLEGRLVESEYLMGSRMTEVDVAIFPFIRQFAFVDKGWFDQSPYTSLVRWLDRLLESRWFTQVMDKYPLWRDSA